MTQQIEALQFPCQFPLKVIGKNQTGFKEAIIKIVETKLGSLNTKQIKTSASQNNNYLSLTITFTATSKEQLDTLYQQLNQHPLVKMTL